VTHHQQEDSLGTRDFARLSELIRAQVGICLGAEKKTMVEGRLKRRLRALNMNSYEEYCRFVFDRRGLRTELVSLIDVITTNKTDFFREPAHFDFLGSRALTEWTAATGSSRPFLAWSAGCSSGEEPYTLAMVLSDYAETRAGFRFRILASDISTAVLAKAEMGIYSEESAAPVPVSMKRKYLLRSRDRGASRVRIAAELRRAVEFRRLNFMDSEYSIAERADAIFCRNVMIYFDRTNQENILRKLSGRLVSGGYLYVGHSESLHDMDLPLLPVAPAIYRKVDARA
jgi:chemotaxis protein methyltransferase CheR